jgi:hypothetical protein
MGTNIKLAQYDLWAIYYQWSVINYICTVVRVYCCSLCNIAKVWCDLCTPLHLLALLLSALPLIAISLHFFLFMSMHLGYNYPLTNLQLVILVSTCAHISGALACTCVVISHITRDLSLRTPDNATRYHFSYKCAYCIQLPPRAHLQTCLILPESPRHISIMLLHAFCYSVHLTQFENTFLVRALVYILIFAHNSCCAIRIVLLLLFGIAFW